MTAKIYSAPEHIQPPDHRLVLDQGYEAYQAAEQAYIDQVRAFVKRQKPRAKYVGEIVRFGVADGHAQYMVMSLRPVELIHLQIGDAWQYQMIRRVTAEDIKELVESEKRFQKIWSKGRKKPQVPKDKNDPLPDAYW